MTNRKIAFRAWASDMNEMQYDPKMGTMKAMSVVSLNESLAAYPTLMQFTGLKDKNGKEIYEGDILRVLDRDWESCTGCHETIREHMLAKATTTSVVFTEGRFELDGYWLHLWANPARRDIFEIIGNIYENPSLL